MQPWRTLTREIVLEMGNFLTVERHRVQLPDGQIIPDWSWVITPDFVNIVPVTPEGRILCFRQTKYAAQGVSLALVGGYLEDAEDPLAAGQRELLEETGYAAPEWHTLGHFVVDGNRGSGRAHFYLALGATPAARKTESDDLEEQELLALSLDDVRQGLQEGQFKVLPWVAALGLAFLKLEELG